MICDVFWGSHGCVLDAGHDGQHWCDCCPRRWTHRFHRDRLGCVGTWPYYGEGTAFFRFDDIRHVDMPDEFARLARLAGAA